MTKVLTFQDIKNASVGDVVEGVLRLGSAEEAQTKRGDTYIRGTLQTNEGNVGFKVWSGNLQRTISDDLPAWNQAPYVYVTGAVDDYNGTRSLVLQDAGIVNLEEYDLTPNDVVPVKYPKDTYWAALNKLMSTNVSPEVYELWEEIITPYADRFTAEFAGRFMHDACPGGLLGHSFKVTMLMNYVFKQYGKIAEHLSKDLLMFVVSLHDLGKIWEYHEGQYTTLSRVSHRVLLNELFVMKRSRIIEVFGEDGYYTILAAEAQHHGEFEERPRTFEGMLVHLIDSFETSITQLNENLVQRQFAEESAPVVNDLHGHDIKVAPGAVRHHGFNLY